jgi:hypothetical protein
MIPALAMPPCCYGASTAAAAHSLPWINTCKAESLEQLAEGGTGGRVTASCAAMGMAIASAALMINEAVRLYEKRATASPR